jgi:16S rRNA (guanine966-N2)-methyltransferase
MVAALVPALAPDAVVVVERHVDSAGVDWPAGFEPTGQKLKKRTFGIARMDMAIWRGAGA